eukprot:s315_g4.t1
MGNSLICTSALGSPAARCLKWRDLWLDWADWQMLRGNPQGVVSTGDDGEFSRMRNGLIDLLRFLLLTLLGTSLLPLPEANRVLAEVGSSHLCKLALAVLELLSCWLASLTCCSLWTFSGLQWQKAKGL